MCAPPKRAASGLARAVPEALPKASLARRLRFRLRRRGSRAPLPPPFEFGIHIPEFRDDRRPALELPPGLNHAFVEVLEDVPDLFLAVLLIQLRVQFGVFNAQQDGRRADPAQPFALDESLDPPVGIVVLAEPGDRFAGCT